MLHLPQAIFKTASCLILIPSPLLRLEHWPRAAPQHTQPGCARLYGDVYTCLYVYKSRFFPRMAVGALRGASGASRRVPAAPPGPGTPRRTSHRAVLSPEPSDSSEHRFLLPSFISPVLGYTSLCGNSTRSM